MESGAIREEERRLKDSIIGSLEAQFVEQFEKWKERADKFNMVVTEYNKVNNKRLKHITYDQFCKLFVRGSKTLLDEHIRMHEIIPSKEELHGMKQAMDNDANEFKQKYALLLEAKYAVVKKKLAMIWDGYVFKHMVKNRYGDDHYYGMLTAKNEALGGED